MALILLLPMLAPLLAAALLVWPAARPTVARLLPLFPVPGLLVALAAPDGAAAYPVLLVGMTLGLDWVGRVFLLVTTVIWSAVGWQLQSSGLCPREPSHQRFLACYLLALTGNLGVLLAWDGPGFYLWFALLSLSAYGLIVTGNAEANRRAGRVYLSLALFGELCMLGAFVLLAAGRNSVTTGLLLYFGAGVKHGVLPLHMWLPPAHGTAPPPASALLSGVLLKAGIVGWLRFMPQVEGALADYAVFVTGAGLAAALLAAVAGILQEKPKMVLAYSSISQMGLLTAGFGAALSDPSSWRALVPALVLFACHHALIKASLFLGLGVARESTAGAMVLPMLVLLCLSLAAAPLSAGAGIKLWLDQLVGELQAPAAVLLVELLPISSTATALLLARFLVLAGKPVAAAEGVGRAHGRPGACLALGAAALLGPWLALALWSPPRMAEAVSLYGLWKTAWPVLLAVGIVLTAVASRLRLRHPLPPGDVLIALEAALHVLRPLTALRIPQLRPPRVRGALLERVELGLRRLPVLGVIFISALLLFVLLASAG